MAVASGSRLGPYEVLSPLGAGGMGEVWKARDTRLGREVAIKVLPEALASDRDRLSRFEQEARSASALNHPNIITIYEIGRIDSVSYIEIENFDVPPDGSRLLVSKPLERVRQSPIRVILNWPAALEKVER